MKKAILLVIFVLLLSFASARPIQKEAKMMPPTCLFGEQGDDLEVNVWGVNDICSQETIFITEVEVENHGSDDLEVSLEAALYDLEEERILQRQRVIIEVDENDEEDFEFEFEIPNSEVDRYAVYVKTYEVGNERNNCNDGKFIVEFIPCADLTVTEIIFDPEDFDVGDEPQINTIFENQGDAAISYGGLLKITRPDGNSVGVVLPYDPERILEPGETANIDFGTHEIPYNGGYTFKVIAVPNDQEYDADNNMKSEVMCLSHPGVLPEDGMIITEDTLLCRGLFELPHGLIIGADDITLEGDDTTIKGNAMEETGIYIANHEGVTVKGLEIEEYETGIWVTESNNISLKDNTVSLCETTIYVQESNNNTLDNNHIFGEDGEGIFLRDSDYNLISNNLIESLEHGDALTLHYSNRNTVTDNIIDSNGDSLRISHSEYNFITENTITNNNDYGIIIRYSENNLLTYNEIVGNRHGIYLRYSPFNHFNLNSIYDNNGDPDEWYEVYNDQSGDFYAQYNYWNSNDPDEISSKIYDYYDDPSLGIVYFDDWLTEDITEENIIINEPQQWSTIITDSVLLDVTTTVNATCEHNLCRFVEYEGWSAGGCSDWHDMETTDGYSHTKLIEGLENTINNETQSEWYRIDVMCETEFESLGTEWVNFLVEIPERNKFDKIIVSSRI
ncbi:MAG: NosD domain-containing protein [Nanoarchaeota archaeon]